MQPNNLDCTQIDMNLFLEILNINSTSGRERRLSDFLAQRLPVYGCRVSLFPEKVDDNTPQNLLLAWGEPRIVFCTHMDTVPPYIAPTLEQVGEDTEIRGRGACDAKGQIISMYTACCQLAKSGKSGFGLLLLYGEETGSYGAKLQREYPGGDVVVVGEPTDCRMVSASKGTKAFDVTIKGKSFHSGYPQYGVSAIDRFVDLVNAIRDIDFPEDPLLGPTTFNIGRLVSDNPQNILSPELKCRIYFRTTFASDDFVVRSMMALNSDVVEINSLGGDTPMHYLTLPGFETTTVAFGSDAPQLSNYKQKMLCGAGSILVAHTSEEKVTNQELAKCVDIYVSIFDALTVNH